MHALIPNFRLRNKPVCGQSRVSSAPSQDIDAAALLPYVTLTEHIWDTRVLSPLRVGLMSSFLADFYARLFRRALLRTPTQAGWRRSGAKLK